MRKKIKEKKIDKQKKSEKNVLIHLAGYKPDRQIVQSLSIALCLINQAIALNDPNQSPVWPHRSNGKSYIQPYSWENFYFWLYKIFKSGVNVEMKKKTVSPL